MITKIIKLIIKQHISIMLAFLQKGSKLGISIPNTIVILTNI